MKSVARSISYGSSHINYALLLMNRKTLEIAVHPDRRVVVKAPASATTEAIESKVRKRARWIGRQIAWFDQFEPRTPARKYVGGESHLYLGRKYRLKIEKSHCETILLKHGYFRVKCRNRASSHIKGMMDAWYQERADLHLGNIFDACWQDFCKMSKDLGNGSGKPVMRLRKMSSRWGSLSPKGRMTLNTELIKAPRECIEYVMIHELCHLVHHHHGPKFYELLERTLPDWKKRKHKLEMALV